MRPLLSIHLFPGFWAGRVDAFEIAKGYREILCGNLKSIFT